MPKILEKESFEKEHPILCVFSNEKEYSQHVFNHYQTNFKLFVVSDSKPKLEKPFYFLPTSSIEKFDTATEKISYMIIVLSSPSEKGVVEKITKNIIKKGSVPIVFVLPVRRVSEFIDIILKYANTPKVSFVLLGDPYSSEVTIHSKASSLLSSLVKTRSFTIEGNDLEPVFPISLADMITGISLLLFSTRKKTHFFYLFYKHPQSLNAFLRMASQIEPDIKIGYQKPNEPITRYQSLESIQEYLYQKIALKPEFIDSGFEGFEKSLVPFFSEKTVKKENISPSILVSENNESKKRNLKPHFARILLAWFLVTSVFLVVLFAFSFYTVYQIRKVEKAYREKDITALANVSNNLENHIEQIDPTVRVGFRVLSPLPLSVQLASVYKDARDLVRLGARLHSIIDTLKTMPGGIQKSEVQSSVSDAAYLYFQSQRLAQQLHSGNAKSLANHSSYLAIGPHLPKLLGYEGEKKYLILFQNNHELRPTGGFIGSIGELTLEDGKIKTFSIRDVYELDGQLTKHVEPHYVIRRYLQPHLYLRDSNFELSFEESAKKAAQLYALEKGQPVDGVIAIDFEVLSRILSIIGPVRLESMNKELTEENAFEIIQGEITNNFFPGSTQKKDILTSLFQKILLQTEENPQHTASLYALFPSLLNEKHILFAFQDPSVQKLMSSLNLSSDVSDHRIADRKTLKDFLLLNEANIGSSKVNQYIKREVSYNIDIQNSQAIGTVKLVIENVSPKDDYLAYVRIGVPHKSTIRAVTINGVDSPIADAITDFRIYENPKFAPPNGIEIDNSFQYDRQVFGFIHTFPKGKREEVEVQYNNSILPRYTGVIQYSLLYQKQPGTPAYPFSFSMQYPANYKATVSDATSFGENTFTVRKNLLTDQELTVTLLEKNP